MNWKSANNRKRKKQPLSLRNFRKKFFRRYYHTSWIMLAENEKRHQEEMTIDYLPGVKLKGDKLIIQLLE